MKKSLCGAVLAAVAVMLLAPAAWAQMGTVKGVAKSPEGKPLVGAIVQLISKENGRKYEVKTDKKGEFFSLGIAPGPYRINLMQDGQMIFYLDGVPIRIGEDNIIDLDLSKQAQQVQQAAKAGQLSEAQKEAIKQQEAAAKENEKIKGLNEKLAAAKAAEDAGNEDQAVQILTEATQLDATRDILWGKLADAQRNAAAKATDAAAKNKDYADSVDSYQKAIAIKPLGAYYNNMGEALAKIGKAQEAMAAYNQAAQLDPPNAGMYYFNLGAILTNRGQVDEAIVAFDKALAADPTKVEAYYQKGVNLLGKATLVDGKMVAPPEAEQALQKYLEMAPTGPNAQNAKDLLASIGASVETSFGKPRAASPPKKK